MHRTLARQLRRICNIESEQELIEQIAALNALDLPGPLRDLTGGLRELLQRVQGTYEENDRDLNLRSRSLEESSRELSEINERMRADIASRNRVLYSVREAAGQLLEPNEANASLPAADDLEGLSALLPDLVAQQEKRNAEFKRMAEKIEASEKQYRALVNSVREVIFRINEAGQWHFLNPVWTDITGYRIEESIGQLFFDSVHHEDVDQAAHLFNQLRSATISHDKREFRLQHKSGSYCYFEVTIQCETDELTQTLSYTGTLSDITERKRISQLQSEFISVVSHELRTPITSVRGALALLDAGAAGVVTPAQLKLIQVAHRNSQRLVTLVNDILDMEKLMAGKMTMKQEFIDLTDLIDVAVEANNGYAHNLGVKLHFSQPDFSAHIMADSDRLMQVLANLLSNAAKFSPKDRPVDISIDQDGACWIVKIRDFGPGIPLDFRPRIFSAFAQANSSDTRQQGGTGLGLKISKALIEKMDGTIDFESELGQGSCFWFSLPKASAPPRQDDHLS
jgi:PAS domain S-box-containing protein